MSDLTLNEIRKAGLEALTEKLGPIGMVKFIQQFERGSGDYTREHQIIKQNLSHETIVNEIKNKN
jgi:hypothetical protein